MLSISSFEAVGPARICAGSPGIRSTNRKTSSETANRVGSAPPRRLRTNIVRPSRRPLLQGHLVEDQRLVGLDREALDTVGDADRLGLVPEIEEGLVLPDDLLDLAIDLLLFRRV